MQYSRHCPCCQDTILIREILLQLPVKPLTHDCLDGDDALRAAVHAAEDGRERALADAVEEVIVSYPLVRLLHR